MADIDFTNAESRLNYLKDNLGHLMNGIDKNYGRVLMDELMHRLEATISEFNEEVKAMLGQLQGTQTAPQDNILASAPKPFTKGPEPMSPPTSAAEPARPMGEIEIEGDQGLSEFEKRLQSLDQ
ncbi:hypothetical protein HQ531_00510 [bacterium]|nr:hypothetical protein [bacterium]